MDNTVEMYLEQIARWRSGENARKDAPFGSDAYTKKSRQAINYLERKIVDHLQKKGSGEHSAVTPKKTA